MGDCASGTCVRGAVSPLQGLYAIWVVYPGLRFAAAWAVVLRPFRAGMPFLMLTLWHGIWDLLLIAGSASLAATSRKPLGRRSMDLQAELRAELHEMIEQVKDVRILQALYVIHERENLHENSVDDSRLDATLQASIDRGLKQIENGETIPHEEIRKRYSRWLE